MKHLITTVVFLIILVPCTPAQEHPKAELFGGINYTRMGDSNLVGWNASIAGNLNRWFGIVADFDGEYGSEATYGFTVHTSVYGAVFGPQFSNRKGRYRGFARVMFGGARIGAGVKLGGNLPDIGMGTTGAIVKYGGGADYSVSEKFSIRIVQVDSHFIWALGMRGNGVRIAAGIVTKF